ncbi:MAG: hypothetical protein U5K74_14525 [Gemmatimonadaceae bacterium]|nr:hypothetical protein [Gemmatimonadaceae bacterium]
MTAPRSRVMAILTVVAVLAIGVALGVAIDRRLLPRRDYRGGRSGPFSAMNEPSDTATRNRMRARIVKRFTDDLALTPAQAAAIDGIFARRELQLDSIRNLVGPQLDSLRVHMRASIDSVLTPEQRVKSAEQRKRVEARWREGEGRRPSRD